jgi:hypothetical protein
MLDAGVSRQHDERNVVPFAREELDELQPRQPRHAIVGDDQVDRTLLEDPERLRDTAGANRRVTGMRKGILEDQADCRLVVDVEDRGHESGLESRAEKVTRQIYPPAEENAKG